MFLTTAILTLGLNAAPPVLTPLVHEDEAASVQWFEGRLDQAIAKAREDKKMVFVYFWRNGSDYCAKLYQETIIKSEVASSLNEFYCVSANHSTVPGAKLVERFKIQTLPTMLFLGPDGTPEDSIAGFIPAGDFDKELERIQRGENTMSDLKAKLAKAAKDTEEDYDLRFRLAGKHQELGNPEEHDHILASIRESDPKGMTPSGARAHLWEAQAAVTRPDGDGKDGDGKDGDGKDGDGKDGDSDGYSDGDGGDGDGAASLNLDPLYAHAKRMKLEEARFEAWNSIGNFEARRGDFGASCKGFQTAWKFVPDDQAINWSQGVASFLINNEGEWTTSKDRKFVLSLAKKGAELARSMDPESKECKEACGDQEYGEYVAYKLGTLGMAYRFNGKQKQAVKTLEDAVALASTDELREQLAVYKGEM